jgi:hypothetical protein
MIEYNAQVKEYAAKGIARKDQEIERLQLSYDTCELNDLGASELASFEANKNIRILAPANACEETLHRLYRTEITIGMKNTS